jgi:PKD repeat protein
MTNLAYNTTFYVRAYATNSEGTGYGNEVSFTTLVPPFPPVVDFEASMLEIVIGQSIDFTDLSTNVPTSWNWSFNGANPMSSNVQNPQGITYNFPGAYTVCLTATNAYGSNTVCKDAYINVVEPVNAQIVITEIMYNSPESGTDSLEYIEFYNNGTEAVAMENYAITSGVEFTFPAMNLNPGEYVLVAVNAAAMQNTFGKTALQWTSGALSNGGEAIALKDNYGFLVDSLFYDDVLPWDTLADGFGYSLVLCDPNLDNSMGENWGHDTTLIAINTAGDSIFGNPGAGCPQAGDPPVANFEGTPTTVYAGLSVQFTNLSTGDPTTYAWTFDGGNPETWNTADPPLITYNTAGVYDVVLTVTNQWGTSTETKVGYIDVITGIDGRDNRGFNVYPNPSAGLFNIDLKGEATLKVYSLLGDVIATYNTENTSFKLNMSRFLKGMYLLEVEYTDGSKHTQRLVVR